MSVLVTMLSLSHTLLFSSLILKVMSSDLPPAYGLDLGDGKGIQLLRRLRVGGEDCPFQGGFDGSGRQSCKCNYVDFYKEARPPC